MSRLYVLFEHAGGYALFRVTEFEETDAFLLEIQKNVSDVDKFKSIVKLVSFQPFKTGRDALENMNSISEGILHPHLQLFLENNLPKKKKHPITLGIQDSKLAAAISESIGTNCSVSGVVPEVIRGVRLHFHTLVEGFKDLSDANKAQLGLGHHYSRARVKFNVNRIDNMIIQSISLVDQLDKDINTFSMRVREWYSHHFPELIKIVPENHLYIQCVGIIKDRKAMSDDVEEKLAEVLMDANKAHNIIEVARSSMGMEISALDMENVTVFAKRIISLVNRRKELMEYLKSKMHSVAPNLATLIGDTVGARLIAHAGSLINLAKFPASTVQILGAEKALFRALKTRGNTPKYGLIYHSTFIGRAGKTNKGRISRYLANKCSVASRIDCFREVPTEVFGQKLRQQVEDRLKFYETGEVPAKNVDVMVGALSEAEVAQIAILKQMKKAKKKEKKRRQELMDSTLNSTGDEMSMLTNDSMNNSVNTEGGELDNSVSKKKKKKENKTVEENSILDSTLNDTNTEEMDEATQKKLKKAKKKERKRMLELQSANSTLNSTANEMSIFVNESLNDSVYDSNASQLNNSVSKKRKIKNESDLLENSQTEGSSKKKKKHVENQDMSFETMENNSFVKKKKKKERMST